MKKKYKMIKRAAALLMAAVFALGSGATALAESEYEATVALGADLTSDQRSTVLALLGLSEDDLENYNVIYVTNDEEHEYLDDYLSSDVIGTRALSSVLIVPGEDGDGLSVTTYNISYCTVSMYTNALITAGLEDAEVYVAGPTSISGTSALIGAVKAYADITDTEIDEEALETAVNEIVVTGDLGESIGDSDTASEIIAYVKQQVAENDDVTDEELEEIINEVAAEYGVTLTADQIQQIIDLMDKVSGLDLDVDALASQASEIYEKLQSMGIDLEDIDTEQVGNFITRFFNQIMNFLNSLIG